MTTYFRVRFHNLSEIHEDILTTLSLDFGASGVSEALEFSQPDLTFEPKVVKKRAHDVDVFFDQKPALEFFDRVRELDSRITWSQFEEEHQDWLEEWKKGFKAFALTNHVWIVPSWLEKPAEASMEIRIDPGMAFGTGTHATTQMAAHLLSKFADKNQNSLAELNLLDVGTGTGILAMLARLSGFGSVKAIDVDPESRRVSQDNIRLNHLDKIEVTEQLLEEVREKYDVVVANIIDGVLIQLKFDLLKVLKANGNLFVSGILVEREAHFFENFIEALNLKVQRRLENDEWVSFWLTRS
ncbi:MAG: 50S ribosomal protein L11 methyltransferase [Bdellovibrionales bacterium]